MKPKERFIMMLMLKFDVAEGKLISRDGEVKIADDKLMCQGEEFSNFASLVDFELFTKLYSMRYMKG